jgi:hypothetical protein
MKKKKEKGAQQSTEKKNYPLTNQPQLSDDATEIKSPFPIEEKSVSCYSSISHPKDNTSPAAPKSPKHSTQNSFPRVKT